MRWNDVAEFYKQQISFPEDPNILSLSCQLLNELIKVSHHLQEIFFKPPVFSHIFDLIEDPIFVLENYILNGLDK